MQRILFFTAGITPTPDEAAAIVKLNSAAEAPYEVLVANGAANAKYGETNRLIPCDFVAGAIPTIYNAIDEIDPDDMPVTSPTPTQVVVNDGDTFITEDEAGVITAHVAAGVLTFTYATAS